MSDVSRDMAAGSAWREYLPQWSRTSIIYTYLFASIVIAAPIAIWKSISYFLNWSSVHMSPDWYAWIYGLFVDRVSYDFIYRTIAYSFYLGLMGIFIYLSRKPARFSMNLRRPRTGFLVILALTVGVLAMGTLYSLFEEMTGIYSTSSRSLHRLYSLEAVRAPIWGFVFHSLFTPIVEELVFRGYIQTRLVRRHGPVLGIVITSVLFGVYHANWVQGVYVALFALFVGTLAYRTSSILPGIMIHVVVNSFSVLRCYYAPDFTTLTLPYIAAAIICFSASVWLLMNFRAKPAIFPSADVS